MMRPSKTFRPPVARFAKAWTNTSAKAAVLFVLAGLAVVLAAGCSGGPDLEGTWSGRVTLEQGDFEGDTWDVELVLRSADQGAVEGEVFLTFVADESVSRGEDGDVEQLTGLSGRLGENDALRIAGQATTGAGVIFDGVVDDQTYKGTIVFTGGGSSSGPMTLIKEE
jgi:hypothetical protein